MESDANASVPDDDTVAASSAGGLAYWGPAVAVSLAMFIGVIDSTLMNVAIPAIVVDLDTTVTVVQGAISFYAMVMAALILPGGKLSSMYGIRRLMTATLLVYGVGTTLAALSWNVVVLYVGWSVIEGAAAAVLLPLTFTVLLVSYEGRDRAKALGILAGVNAAGAAFGPLLGGAVTTFASWRWGFGIEVLIVLVALFFVRYLPREPLTETRSAFDVGGTVLSVVGTTALVAGVLFAGRYGWVASRRPFVVGDVRLDLFGASPTVWLVGLGIVVFAAFVQYERRIERRGGSPLVPVRLLANGAFTAGVVTNASRSLVLAGFIFVVPVFLQSGAGYTAFETGVAMLPFSVATFVTSLFTTDWRRFVPSKTLIQGGIVLMGLGILSLVSRTTLDATLVQLAVPMALVGLGLGLVMAQLIDVTLSSVDAKDAAAASGLMNATMMLGYSFGTAIVGTYLLRRFYGGVVDGVFAAVGTDVSAGDRAGLVSALEDAAETATKETQREFLDGLSAAQRELLVGVFDSAIVQAQRETLLLLTLLVLLVLLLSTLLPGGETDAES
ncbi:Major Facilitator Superfamily protein [Halogeometricum rufum]|uniref:Major Facilitator Superfamily protein n=1 Tax=Halogeometricum rufum TaxID=553469 RepID=A0A1I6IGD5_9EURY|nr:MFS transporter [Halogeometricum rufum]SFR65815.1 Major Facilitator Superfamily protein [Halogeometricum rufum]